MLNQYFGKRGVCLPVFKMVVSAIDPKLICRKSTTRAAIPILPMPAATFCFFLNLLIPGLGTILSGILVCCCCCGRTRYDEECDGDSRFCSFVMNSVIGLSQFATILLCLVGWCWSVGWGITLISVSKRNQDYLCRQHLRRNVNHVVPITTMVESNRSSQSSASNNNQVFPE